MICDVTLYHNPSCGTSRNALALIRAAGIEPRVIEYLKTPLSRGELKDLLIRAGMTARELLREKETLCAELGLNHPGLSEDVLLDAMAKHPILMNRPLAVTPLGVRLCRPAERIADLLQEKFPVAQG